MPKHGETCYNISIRCQYDRGQTGQDDTRHYTQHTRNMPLKDIPKWVAIALKKS